MKIGIDLDHTVYGFPDFFREFIPAMVVRGHKFYCTSNHTQSEWPRDREILRGLGIDPDMIDPCYLPTRPVAGKTVEDRQARKAPSADLLDIVFDDHADFINPHCKTPVVKMPGKKSQDRGTLLK